MSASGHRQHAALLRDPKYGYTLARLYRSDEFARLERLIAYLRPSASAVNVSEAINLAVEAFERTVLKGAKDSVLLAEHGFPYRAVRSKILWLALSQLHALSRARREFRSHSRVAANGSKNAITADGGSGVRHSVEPWISSEEGVHRERQRYGTDGVDPVFTFVSSKERHWQFYQLLKKWRKADREMYIFCRTLLVDELLDRKRNFFGRVARRLGCTEGVARRHWARRLRAFNAPGQLPLDDIFSSLA